MRKSEDIAGRAGATPTQKRVAIAGTFDVANYGDLLFPLVADYRLRPKALEIVPVSPTSGTTVFADAMRPAGMQALLSGNVKVDAILIGGGYIVHLQPLDFLAEYRDAGVGRWGVPSLWLGATLAAALLDIPIAWNAPGVPLPFSTRMREGIVAAGLRAADYVSVRDRASAQLLDSQDGLDIEVVPDTALDLANVLPRSRLEGAFSELLRRKSSPAGAHYFAVHLRDHTLGEVSIATLAGFVDALATQRGWRPILVCIGPSLGDVPIARRLSALLVSPHILLDDPGTLAEVAAVIAFSHLYVGASMHGYVTAACYGVPGVIMARPAHKKFSGLLELIERPQDLTYDWRAAFEAADRNLATSPRSLLPASIPRALDAHWNRVASAISDPTRRRDHRHGFVREYLRRALPGAGADWLLSPFLPQYRVKRPDPRR